MAATSQTRASRGPGGKTSADQVESTAQALAEASGQWANTAPADRARALVGVAAALADSGSVLVPLAERETGLSTARLTGELARTVVQLRLFADVVIEGAYLDVRIDEADKDFVLGTRPDVRRFNAPAGPVLNFAASNFPFAFSVAGGDTTAALAAGCTVVVKAHPGHPELSARTAQTVSDALAEAGAPDGVFALITGQDAGIAMLRDPRVAVATFTGSQRAGQLLSGIANDRETPIPFFGELGSVNPVFVTEAALVQRGPEIAEGFVTSVSGSAGQLCTKPGFLFVPSGRGVDTLVGALAAAVPEHRMLYPALADAYERRRDAVLSAPGVSVLAEGSFRRDDLGQGWVTPTIALVSIADLEQQRFALLDESFGPLSIVVRYDESDLTAVAARLFDGNLTATVQLADGEDSAFVRSLLDWIGASTGRLIVNGWPTGVSVTPAMQHGGPWPATTFAAATSVGTASIARFLRPVAYQGVPQSLLPAPLRDDNPWSVPQTRNPAGSSNSWGAAQSRSLES